MIEKRCTFFCFVFLLHYFFVCFDTLVLHGSKCCDFDDDTPPPTPPTHKEEKSNNNKKKKKKKTRRRFLCVRDDASFSVWRRGSQARVFQPTREPRRR